MSGDADATPDGVQERPSYLDFLVGFGMLVVVSLDPVASVAALKDQRATEEAAAIPRNKHLAIVCSTANDAVSWPVPPSSPPLGITIWLVGQHPPGEPNSNAYFALFPSHAHPDGRAPILLEPALPWPEAYVQTIPEPSARVIRVHTSKDQPYCLKDDQLIQIMNTREGDVADATNSKRMDTTGSGGGAHTTFSHNPTQSSAAPRGNGSVGHEGGAETGRDSQAKGDLGVRPGIDLSTSYTDTDGDSDSSSSSKSNHPGEEPFKMRLHIEVWLDITTLAELGDPSAFMAQTARLNQIEQEWRVRATQEMLTDQPHTREWVQAVAAAGGIPPEEPEAGTITEATEGPTVVSSPVAISPIAPTSTATDQGATARPAKAQAKSRHSIARFFSRVVDVPRRFFATLVALLPTRRKPKSNVPAPSPTNE